MRIVKLEYKVYEFKELSEEAKDNVRKWYIDDEFRCEILTETYKNDLHYLFPNSKLDIQWSLNSRQGDGVNIYGELDLVDVFTVIRNREYAGNTFKDFWDYLTEKEQKTIEAYMEVNGRVVELPYNNSHYSYCVSDGIEFAWDWIENLEYQQYKNIKTKIIQKMEKLIGDMFSDLCRKYEEDGYKFLYHPDDEEIEGDCEANEWEFLEDGTFFAA